MKQDYFRRREPAAPATYEEAYWGASVGPDGSVSHRPEERQEYREHVAEQVRYLQRLPAGRLVDLGCGLGFLLSGLGPEWEKHGVEVSRFAAKHAAQWGTIYVGELAEAAYPDAYFDVVVMHYVIEHMQDPIGTILEVRRILKRGGTLLLSTPDFDSGCARHFGQNYHLLHDDTRINLFTNESMHRFLRDHGFVIDRVAYPFFETQFFTAENLMRLFDTSAVSPPFYGNVMTFYCQKPDRGYVYESVMDLSRLAAGLAEALEEQAERAGQLVAEALLAGGKVLVCGNGGSAADAQHFVAELVGRMDKERRPFPALTLSADPSVVTALSNDYGYEHVFARQVEGLGKAGDVLIALSTSGHSPNVLNALDMARQRGLCTIVLVGQGGDPSLQESDVYIPVPTPDTQRVQEIHTAVLHALCYCLERQVAVAEAVPNNDARR